MRAVDLYDLTLEGVKSQDSLSESRLGAGVLSSRPMSRLDANMIVYRFDEHYGGKFLWTVPPPRNGDHVAPPRLGGARKYKGDEYLWRICSPLTARPRRFRT